MFLHAHMFLTLTMIQADIVDGTCATYIWQVKRNVLISGPS